MNELLLKVSRQKLGVEKKVEEWHNVTRGALEKREEEM